MSEHYIHQIKKKILKSALVTSFVEIKPCMSGNCDMPDMLIFVYFTLYYNKVFQFIFNLPMLDISHF